RGAGWDTPRRPVCWRKAASLCYLARVRWTPDDLTQDAQGRLVQRGHRPIEGAFIDSRAPRVDGLFVPIVAARDGHAFIGAALEGGASAVLIQAGHRVPDGVPEQVTIVEVDDTLRALT